MYLKAALAWATVSTTWYSVEKALEKIKKTPAPVKRAGKAKDDDDESSVIKTM